MKNIELAEKFIADMRGRDITKQEGNFSTLLYCSPFTAGFSPYIDKYYNFDFKSFAFLNHGKYGVIFFDLEIYKDCTRESFLKYLKLDKKSEFKENNDFEDFKKEINQLYESNSPLKLSELDYEEIDKLAKRICHLGSRLLAATIFCEGLDEDLVRELFNNLKVDKIIFDDFFAIGSKSSFDSFVMRMDKLLLEMASKMDLYKMQWLLCDYFVAPGLQKIKELLEKTIKEKGGINKIRAEYEKILLDLASNKKEVDEYKDKLPRDLVSLLEFMQLAMYVRDIRKESLQKALTLLSNISREIFKRKKMSSNDINYVLSPYDFMFGLYKDKNYAEEIENRKQGITTYWRSKEISYEVGDIEEVKRLLFDAMDKTIGGIKEIKGNIGCRGHVKGKVNIILSERDFHKFKPGNILVTSMTRPEFVPLMKKAAAVITDEGGITCHAAIVSRELGLPCVIGTKNATRLLKDGENVEVDANKGIIKLLKRK